MAEILSSVASDLVGSLASLAVDEIKFLMGVPEEIQMLRVRLERFLPVLSDADARRLQDQAVNVWVKQLRDVVYDADDIIEECKLGSKKSSLRSSTFFCQLDLRRHKIGNKISCINQRLDDLLKDINILNLIPGNRSSSSLVESRIISRETSPVVEPDLVGETIEEDVTTLVNMLVSSKESKRGSRIRVFAIVGMGGIGKTTLAQKIFNDDRITTQFRSVTPIWKCVSQDFSEIDVLREIIRGLGGDPGHDKKKEKLEPMLAEIIKDKRFFLVLDDVWDARVWEELLYKPLQNCSEGSRVLVTTRHEEVALGMKAVHRHTVRRLSDEDGWLLIRKSVLLDDEDAGDLPDNLRDVGMKIVKKCDGLPLALKVIAGVLRKTEVTQGNWERVLHNLLRSFPELHMGVSGVLYLSYTELPSHLKRCFLYFSLFPEVWEFRMQHVIHMWIAEGFVETKGDMLMEELAKRYWEELVHRSLLQPDISYPDLRVCKMHDLLHSLARHLASDECVCLDMHELNKKSTSSSRSVRHLNVQSSVESISDVITKHASSRTLLVPFLKNFDKHDATRLKCLRILSLEGSSIDNLPNSIGGLIYLRYLNLADTPIRKIPESAGKLVNLQFLILKRCCNLHKLPNSVVNLCNLRCLALGGTELHSMPVGIGRLSNLVTLGGFMVYGNKKDNREVKKPEYCSLEELGSLSHLLDLHITKLEDTTSKEVARAAALKDKCHLTDLVLECTPCSSDEKIEKIGEVIRELCPPPCIEYLQIDGYFGREYPSWMMNSPSLFLPNLRVLCLVNCKLTEQLPPLGLLPQLGFLLIKRSSAVEIIGPEFFGVDNNKYPCQRHFFPKLKVLTFRDMPNWEEWSWLREEENDDQKHALLPCLQYLGISQCPKLRSLPEGILRRATALKELRIYETGSLTRIENLCHLERLLLDGNPQLERISNLPALKELHLRIRREGGDPRELKITESFNSLHTVWLEDDGIESLPEWLEEAGSLRKLAIDGVSTKLLLRCLPGGQEWQRIQQIARFDAYGQDAEEGEQDYYYIHYTRSPFSFDTNLSLNNDDDEIANKVGGTSSSRSSNATGIEANMCRPSSTDRYFISIFNRQKKDHDDEIQKATRENETTIPSLKRLIDQERNFLAKRIEDIKRKYSAVANYKNPDIEKLTKVAWKIYKEEMKGKKIYKEEMKGDHSQEDMILQKYRAAAVEQLLAEYCRRDEVRNNLRSYMKEN